MRLRILLAGLLMFACGRRQVPVSEVGSDAVPGLIEVELRTPDRAGLPGEILDAEDVEDPEWGDAFSLEHVFELRVDPAREGEILAALRQHPNVIWAEPVTTVQGFWLPNDPDFSKQWHLKAAGAPAAWDTTRGEGVTVAVIDTGIFPVDDLDPARIVKGFNFVGRNEDARDDHGHGTHVAGTVAQTTGNGKGVAGMAPSARLMPVKVLSASGGGTSHEIAEGIRWAVDHGARVLNLSLGGGSRSLAMESAVAYARRKGAVVACAAGNSGSRGVSYPAAYPGAFAVSAVGPQGRPAPYTSYGPEVAIAAPGGDKSQGEEAGVLQQTLAEGDPTQSAYRWFQGTSMATPHVAGAAALVMSVGVTNPAAVERLLQSTAASAGDREKYGAGLLDAAAAVRTATFWWGLFRVLFAAAGAFIALRHARAMGQLRPNESPAPTLYLGIALGAGAMSMLAPLAAERIAALSFLAVPPAALAQRFFGLPGTSLTATALAYAGFSPLLPLLVALPARLSRHPSRNAFGGLAAGLCFGWAGMLLHAALFRTAFLPWMPALVTPLWLGLCAAVAWAAGRGLLARERLT